jgi:hypothetical protein
VGEVTGHDLSSDRDPDRSDPKVFRSGASEVDSGAVADVDAEAGHGPGVFDLQPGEEALIMDVDLDLIPVSMAWVYCRNGKDEAMEHELDYLEADELDAVAKAAERMADFARRLAAAKRDHA